MPKIKMLRDDMGSLDGFTVKGFLKDQEYEVNDSLAKAFVDHLGSAVLCADGCKAEAPKSVAKADENKALQPAIENKSGKGSVAGPKGKGK